MSETWDAGLDRSPTCLELDALYSLKGVDEEAQECWHLGTSPSPEV
eukprot:CAMPEP_0175979756 /NCGR_PEP_ID=MMETSP0108-20121206/46418_1 /TAXON_ID=195067 ORGANISM="Goniomonas pacifica, Strain CCMP1869" /NCGR_SAMPLE_ID=MMETSP0108 /ASSEMBLY_ACC=CAM_ASM_000204 /LENGTH=45 /DNA_ID= /DNA_START= /DNA_END= /DNA_ORIENTATION=